MKTRICSTCKIEKPIEEFVKNKYKSSGFSWYCKLCKSAIDKEYYKTHIKRQEQTKIRRDKVRKFNKTIIKSYLQFHNCVMCNNTDIRVLEFHHRNPKEKEYCISMMLTHNSDNLLRELNKCDIVCANCHRIIHCPHSEMDIT
jgi:hypothetical protein